MPAAMAAMAIPAITGALGGGGKGGGGGGLGKMFSAKQEGANKKEAEKLQRAEGIYSRSQDREAIRRAQELAPEMQAPLTSEALAPEMLGATKGSELGGAAFEQVLNSASGYNPVNAVNPYMQVLAGDRAAMAALQKYAQENTARTLEGFEADQARTADAYNRGREFTSGARDRMQGAYKDSIAGARDKEQEDMAQLIVESWINSNARDSAGGIDAFQQTNLRGKVKGADEGAKNKYIQDMLSKGLSYSEILNDPLLRRAIGATNEASGLYSDYTRNF